MNNHVEYDDVRNICKIVLEKCNYESLFCMVLLKTVAVLLKTKCYVTCYTAYTSSTFDIL